MSDQTIKIVTTTGCTVVSLGVILLLIHEWRQSRHKDEAIEPDSDGSKETVTEIKSEGETTPDSTDGTLSRAKNYIKNLMPFGG